MNKACLLIFFIAFFYGCKKDTGSFTYIKSAVPVIHINTNNYAAIDSKSIEVDGKINIDSSAFSGRFEGSIKIRLRGNTTLGFPKLPYKIKLSTKASILGMPAQKNWVLLANYSDKTLMRNYLAFKGSEIFSLPYTPRSRFVDVFINGVYKGNYQLTEDIRVDKNRVDINEMAEDHIASDNITGGYLLEFDQRRDSTDIWVTLNSGLSVIIHQPDHNNPTQNNYIKNYLQATENAIYATNFNDTLHGYAKYLNTETLIKWFWVNELMKNNDANFFSSVWMYKDRNGLLNFGPVWDFDLAAGNINYSNCQHPQGWWVRDAPWISRLFQDTAFTQKAITQWEQVRPALNNLPDLIDNTALYLSLSQKQNFAVWPILNQYVWPNPQINGSFNGEISFLKSWLQQRINWIDTNIQTLQN